MSLKHRLEELHQTASKLSAWLAELETFTAEANDFFEQSNLLFEQGNLLIAAREREEAYSIVTNLATLLFPTESGALCLQDHTDAVKVVAAWGTGHEVGAEFSFHDCWALRQSRPHLVSDAAGLRCKHLGADESTNYLCVPMIAQGRQLGILHLRKQAGHPERANGGPAFPEAKLRLATGVANHIAHGIANLRVRETLHEQATQDQLTGLLNRRAMEEKRATEVGRANRNRRPVGVIMFDIDHFKRYNTDHTHVGADQLLKALGTFLKDSFCRRAGDVACRYGGEEFLLILPEIPREVCLAQAERLRQEVQHLDVRFQDHRLPPVSVSLGVAVCPDHGTTAETLLRSVSRALRHAKRTRNCVVDVDDLESSADEDEKATI